MRVWIDQKLCNGNGLCVSQVPEVFILEDDGLAYVREGERIFAASHGQPECAAGKAEVPAELVEAVLEVTEECPLECVFVEG
jgi:ferredoxin